KGKSHHNETANQNDRGSKNVELKAAARQGGKESWPHLEANCVDEQDETEVANEFQNILVNMETCLSKNESGKQYAGCSQSNASKSETSKHQTKGCDNAQCKNRVGNHPRSQIIHPPKHCALLLDDLVLTKVSRSLSVVHASHSETD